MTPHERPRAPWPWRRSFWQSELFVWQQWRQWLKGRTMSPYSNPDWTLLKGAIAFWALVVVVACLLCAVVAIAS